MGMTFYDGLLAGDYDDNWPSHEEIVAGSPRDGEIPAATYGKPVWTGEQEPITLLVNAEFGDGDTIHFWRFIEQTKALVSKVILRCNADFRTLFTGVEIVDKEEPLPEFDKIIHMMALPKALGVKKAEISGKPYLEPNHEDRASSAIQCISLLRFHKFGVCWAGNPFNPRDVYRSIPTNMLSVLDVVEGLRFFTLNKLYLPPESYIDSRGLMTDWNQTAHLLNQMTLVITVDTALAHLAGAMGRPVWMLTPDQEPDWRWGLTGDRTLWYDSMRLYRRDGNWEPTLELVARDFLAFVEQLNAQTSGLRLGM